jgi:hypothetical protein
MEMEKKELPNITEEISLISKAKESQALRRVEKSINGSPSDGIKSVNYAGQSSIARRLRNTESPAMGYINSKTI